MKVIPDEQEASSYKDVAMEREKMAIPDIFFMELVKVPAFEARIRSLHFIGEYAEQGA